VGATDDQLFDHRLIGIFEPGDNDRAIDGGNFRSTMAMKPSGSEGAPYGLVIESLMTWRAKDWFEAFAPFFQIVINPTIRAIHQK
jgi:hypothetical protein